MDCAEEQERDPFADRFGPPPLRLLPREPLSVLIPPEPVTSRRLARVERGLWVAFAVIMVAICAVVAQLGGQPS